MLPGIEAQWRHRLWALGTVARSPVSTTPLCTRCDALRRGSRWLSAVSGLAAAPKGRAGSAKNTWAKAPNLDPIPNKSLRVPMNRELVKPLLRYPGSRASNMSRDATHRSTKTQIMQEDYWGSKGIEMPMWDETLRTLESLTPKRTHPWKRHAVKVVIRDESVPELTTNLDNNLWDIHDRTSCEIELYKGIEGDGCSAVLLSGDDVAVQDAAAIIMGVCEGAKLVRQDPSNPGAPLLRGDPDLAKKLCISSKVTHQPRSLMKLRRSPYFWNHRLEDIPKPQTWDQFSFINYIRTLTLVKLRPHRAIEFYGTPQAADEVVMVLIHEAFRDRSAADALTVAAFKLGLECMEERGLAFRPHSRRLFTQMQIRRLPCDTDVFNKFLLGSARVRDLPTFNQMLDFMTSYGCVPNYQTWRLFLQMVHDEKAKRVIVKAMDRVGLLHNPHAIPDIVRELVGFDMYRAVEEGKDVKTFCGELDRSYGPSWPSVTALNRMLNVCSHFGRYDMCYELLDHFEQVYRKFPEVKTFVTLLAGVRATNSFPAALSILRRAEKQHWLRPTFHFYRDLFSIAWRTRLPNVMAVIWTYACLEESTCFSMRFLVASHLSQPGYQLSPEFRRAPPGQLYRHFSMPGYVPVELQRLLAEELRAEPAQRAHQGAVLSKLFRAVYGGYKPALPMSDMIDRAWAIDRRLIARRQAAVAAAEPGSHVVGIGGAETPPAAGGDGAGAGPPPEFIEVPIRGGRDGAFEKTIRVPVTSTTVVHNYAPGWFRDVKAHPRVRYQPGRCEILAKGSDVWDEDAGAEFEGSEDDEEVES